jgi:hypothetical protein
LPFGGAVMGGAGDFRQVLPIVVPGSRADIVRACLKHSPLWPKFHVLRLTENMRALVLEQPGADARRLHHWADFLLNVSDGTQPTDRQGDVQLPDYLQCSDNSLQGLITTMYSDIATLDTNSTQYAPSPPAPS